VRAWESHRPTTPKIMTTGDKGVVYVYMGEEGCNIPRDLTNVNVLLTVKAIKDRAFQDCTQLSSVVLGNGLEEVCISWMHIAT
jgi:hypothetical protein